MTTPVPPNPDSASDDTLMDQFRQGRVEAFKLLFLRHIGLVVRYAASLCGNWETARDLAQEVFLKISLHAGSYDGRSKFKSWMLTMTRNMVIDLKRRKTAKTVTLPDNPDRWAPFADPRNPADGVVAEASMSEWLKGLTPEQREVMLLKHVEQLSYTEISEITGMREGTLRQIVFRALCQIRKEAGTHAV